MTPASYLARITADVKSMVDLAAVHMKAPGILDRVFGKDGDFEDAPDFACPLRVRNRYVEAHEYAVTTPHALERLEEGLIAVLSAQGTWWAALDLCDLDPRVPTVGARIAGLCAEAIMGRPALAAFIVAHNDGIDLYDGRFRVGSWDRLGSGYGLPIPPVSVPGGPWPDATSFLAALFMELSPLIAALGGVR